MTIIDPYVWQMQQKYGAFWELKKCAHKDCTRVPDRKVFIFEHWSYQCNQHAKGICNVVNFIAGFVGGYPGGFLEPQLLSEDDLRKQKTVDLNSGIRM